MNIDIATRRIGETVTAKNGLKATIRKYNSNKDITIQFEDGTIVNGIQYGNFVKGMIGNPKLRELKRDLDKHRIERIGETNINKQGLLMTIVEYRTSRDIDIKLETGEVLKHREYKKFKTGSIKRCDYSTKKQDNRLGETVVNNKGILLEIIDYKNAKNITVRFEDGSIKSGVEYQKFKEGSIMHPKFKDIEEAYQYDNIKYFLCTCRKCKGKHILSLDEMKNFECNRRL